MEPAQERMLPLERRLPLLLATVLLATMAIALFVTNRALVRGAEQNAEAGLLSAIQVIVESLESSARTREAQLRAVAASPAIRRLLAAGGAPAPADVAAAERAVVPVLARSVQGAAVELLDARGAMVARWGAALPAQVRPSVTGVYRPPAGSNPAAAWTTRAILIDGEMFAGQAVQLRDARGQHLGTLVAVRRGNTQPGVSRTLRGLTGEDVTLYLGNAGEDRWISHPGGMVRPAIGAGDGHDTMPRFGMRPGTGKVIAVERRVANTPWVAVLELPLQAVHASPMRTTQRLALVFLLLALAGAALTWRITRGVTHPIRQLTAAADQIAHGHVSTAVDLDRTDELGQLATSFNAMAAQIATSRSELERRIVDVERANRAKRDFLAMMSHELRTPLNAIAGYTQLLEMGIHGPVTPEQRNALERIAGSQRHLLRLIEDVLSFARLDAGRVVFTLAEIDLEPSIANALSMVEPQARAKRIALTSRISTAGLTVYADREKLDQILLNLLGNAVKFTPADGAVEISAEALALPDAHGRELVEIRVSDTGPGIAESQREAIFDPFVQGERGLNRPSEGVGLGLAISRDLASGMEGRVALDPSRPRGATFTVTLLRHAPAAGAGEAFHEGEAPRKRVVPV